MKKLLPLCLIGLALAVPQATFACTIPVFRYALERWELGTYEILVYHRGPLPADVQGIIKPWTDGAAKGNVEITTIDLAGKMTPAQQKLWDRDGNKDASAWMLVRFQSASAKEPSAWGGPCTAEHLQGMLTSPLRQTLMTQLAGGASVVFILLTSDDAAADAKGLALLRKQLPILEKQIKLPVQSDDGPKMRLPLPLKVALPVLTLNRNDPAEAGLVRLLLATEEGLDKEKGPILFPVFGRGRVLGALYGKEFTEAQIYEATNFLCRDCSCQVKELNPGVDLLMAADWNRIFDEMFETKEGSKDLTKEVAVASRPSESAVSAPNLVAAEPQKRPAPVVAMQSWQTETSADDEAETTCCGLDLHFWLMIATGIAGALVVVSGGWLLRQAWR